MFLGIENILDEDLAFLRAGAKNARREGGRSVGNATTTAIDCFTGTACSWSAASSSAIPATPASQLKRTWRSPASTSTGRTSSIPTPYPGTPMTRDFRERDLIVSDDVDEYDGTTAVVRSEHLDATEIEFMRWRAERWMKVQHFWPVLLHSPWFVLRHGHQMVAHTFRGLSWRSLLGLETEQEVFDRYKTIRRLERRYL